MAENEKKVLTLDTGQFKEELGETTKPQSNRQSRGRICQVCGDKALGYNFNALSCESCKAFFRRNALSRKDFTCPFNQNCEITLVTRRFCQKCRLEKCLSVGMKSEYIMSEADKMEKRKKIESNRAKRETVKSDNPSSAKRIKSEDAADETSSWSSASDPQSVDFSGAYSPAQYSGVSSVFQESHSPHPFVAGPPQIEVLAGPDQQHNVLISPPSMLVQELTPCEIVNRIICEPEKSSQAINALMPSQQDALKVMAAVINSKTDALRLIDHFIVQPADALSIIAKIMNSALDSLSVFLQFMSSPTDALQIISKIMTKPDEVLQFLQQLNKYPQNALDIMEKFMSEPAEALKMINFMINNEEVFATETSAEQSEHERLRKCVEGNLIKSIISTNTIEVSPALEGPVPPSFNPFSTYVPLSYPSTSNANACEEILNPIPKTTNPVPAIEEKSCDPTRDILEEVDGKPIHPSSIEAILCEAIKIEFGVLNSKTVCRDLSDAEQAKLNELIVANKALYAPVDEDWANLISENARLKGGGNQQNPQLLTVINLTAIAIRRLIKMAKKIGAFKNMCQEDQVALLKGGCVEMMILRSVMQYDCDKATWKIPHSSEEMSNIKADILKLAKGNVYQEHDQFIKTFDKKLRTDENVILIMCAITLFTHDRPRTIHADVIKLEQNSYYYLLRRYLESVYSGCEAKATFLKLIQKIKELHKLNEEIVNVYLDVNPTQVEPLLREIFDLKVNLVN